MARQYKDNVVPIKKGKEEKDDNAPRMNVSSDGKETQAEKMHREIENMVSYFDKSLKKHRKKLKKNNQSLADAAGNVAVLKSLLEMLITLIPTAEKTYKKFKNERGAYAIAALVTQTREISADIQRYSSSQKNASVLIDSIIIPNIQLILQNYMSTNSVLINSINKRYGKKEGKAIISLINQSMTEHSSYLKQITEAISQRATDYFSDK